MSCAQNSWFRIIHGRQSNGLWLIPSNPLRLLTIGEQLDYIRRLQTNRSFNLEFTGNTLERPLKFLVDTVRSAVTTSLEGKLPSALVFDYILFPFFDFFNSTATKSRCAVNMIRHFLSTQQSAQRTRLICCALESDLVTASTLLVTLTRGLNLRKCPLVCARHLEGWKLHRIDSTTCDNRIYGPTIMDPESMILHIIYSCPRAHCCLFTHNYNLLLGSLALVSNELLLTFGKPLRNLHCCLYPSTPDTSTKNVTVLPYIYIDLLLAVSIVREYAKHCSGNEMSYLWLANLILLLLNEHRLPLTRGQLVIQQTAFGEVIPILDTRYWPTTYRHSSAAIAWLLYFYANSYKNIPLESPFLYCNLNEIIR